MYTKDFAGLTKALIFCSSTHRYYLSPEDYSVLKKIEHGVQPDRDLVFLDEFGIQSFIVKGNAIYYHETKTSGNRFKRSISLPLKGKDSIRNVRYRFEARSKVKDIVLVATDSSFFVINPVVGKYFEVSRKMNTSENLAAMTKSIYGNGRTEGNNYYLQHNTLSFLGKSNLVVLGEGLYDLGKGQFTSLSVPNLTHAYPVYRNYSDLRFLVGNDRENVKRYDVKDGQTLNFGTDSTVFDRLFFNNKTRNLYACTSNEVYKNSSVVNMDLNYAKTNSIKLATWHKISISDATRTYVFQYDTFEQKELGQLYLLSTGKRISSIPAKPGYRISKALFWQSWQYLFYIETKADGSESKLRMWNTVDGTYRDIGSPGAYNFALNEGHKEIAVAYPDKVVKYSLVDYKKSNKLKINGIKDMGMTTTGFVYFIKEEYADNSKLANDKDLPDLVKVSHRGVKVNDTEKSVGLQNSFNLMKEMFEDVNRTSGIQVISAAAGNSYALESDEWKNGIFTYCLLEAMRENEVRKAQSVPTCDLNKDDFCSVSELRYYVGQRVEELTNGLQKPTSRQGNLEFDFRIW